MQSGSRKAGCFYVGNSLSNVRKMNQLIANHILFGLALPYKQNQMQNADESKVKLRYLY